MTIYVFNGGMYLCDLMSIEQHNLDLVAQSVTLMGRDQQAVRSSPAVESNDTFYYR